MLRSSHSARDNTVTESWSLLSLVVPVASSLKQHALCIMFGQQIDKPVLTQGCRLIENRTKSYWTIELKEITIPHIYLAVVRFLFFCHSIEWQIRIRGPIQGYRLRENIESRVAGQIIKGNDSTAHILSFGHGQCSVLIAFPTGLLPSHIRLDRQFILF